MCFQTILYFRFKLSKLEPVINLIFTCWCIFKGFCYRKQTLCLVNPVLIHILNRVNDSCCCCCCWLWCLTCWTLRVKPSTPAAAKRPPEENKMPVSAGRCPIIHRGNTPPSSEHASSGGTNTLPRPDPSFLSRSQFSWIFYRLKKICNVDFSVSHEGSHGVSARPEADDSTAACTDSQTGRTWVDSLKKHLNLQYNLSESSHTGVYRTPHMSIWYICDQLIISTPATFHLNSWKKQHEETLTQASRSKDNV